MATYYARKAGNINAADVWATTPTGTAAAVTFASGDILVANSFAIAVNVSTNLGSTGEVRNDNTGGTTAGGSFTLANGVTLTANVFTGATSAPCVTFGLATPNSATISGNITAGNASNAWGVSNTGTGPLNIIGNCTAGLVSTAHGVNNTAGGIINITGNAFGSAGANCHGVNNAAGGTINITGSCTGGSITPNSSFGVNNAAAGVINITGNCTGGSASGNHGANNNGLGTLTIIGPVAQGGKSILTGGSSTGAFGANNASTGVMNITGPIYASEFDGGVGSANRSGLNFLTGPFYTSPTWGVNPIRCVSWRWATNLVNTTFIEVPTANLADKRNLVTPDNATNFPEPANVRSGTTYGIEGALVGSCAVPLPAQVAPGVSIDNTIGTLPTPSAAQNAAAVRQELAVELARIDAAISSRLSPSGTLATVTNLTNAPASVTPSDIWSHASRTITGGTVTTLTNAPSVPSAASIRAEIDSNSTQLAAIKAKTDAVNVDRINNTATLSQVGNLLAQANS